MGSKTLNLSTRYLPMLAAALLSAGCTMIPDYQRPDAPLAAGYEAAAAPATSPLPAGDIGWRQFFTDPQLRALIETALKNNRDLRVTALNVEAARAQYRIQRGALLPTIAVTGTEQSNKFPSGVVATGAGAGTGAGGTTVGTDSITRFYNVGVGVTSYELDIFGRIRSLNQARLADYLALEETRLAAQISLVAEVANAYFALIADQRLLTVTRTTLESQQASLKLSQQRLEAGATDALTLRQVETSVYTAQASLAQYTRQLQLDRNALTQLLGVSALPADLRIDEDGLNEDALAARLAPGLPSELLTRRPDVLAAEHRLVAANANIGAARAAFFPRITLTGSYGTANSELDGLFDKGSTAWSFAPSISIPIFAGGANRAGLDLAKVQKDIGIAQYEGAIQTAFREVADGLAARATLDDELVAQQGLVNATGESLKLAKLRFDRGVDNYLSVLDSQRSQFGAQQTLEQLKLSRLQNLVTLYKALGGGWSEDGGKRSDG